MNNDKALDELSRLRNLTFAKYPPGLRRQTICEAIDWVISEFRGLCADLKSCAAHLDRAGIDDTDAEGRTLRVPERLFWLVEEFIAAEN